MDESELKPVAWRYRWKLDGEWTKWHVADHSQKSPYLRDLEEQPLYPAALLDEVERLRAALTEARQFINEDSPDWRLAKLEILKRIDRALNGDRP